jgi:hypothetical protein
MEEGSNFANHHFKTRNNWMKPGGNGIRFVGNVIIWRPVLLKSLTDKSRRFQ